jgi:hypothetical protein
MGQQTLTTCHVFCLSPELLAKYSVSLLIKAEAPAIATHVRHTKAAVVIINNLFLSNKGDPN